VLVSQAAAGVAAYLRERIPDRAPVVVVGYDGRRNSDVFARDSAELFAGAGLRAVLLPRLLPTPVLAFALRFGVKSFNPWWFLLLSPLVVVAQSMLSPIPDQFFEQGGEQLATVAFALTGVILLFVAQAWIVRSLRHQSRIFSPGFHQFGRLNTGA
jgi:hypothetical protein